jgi:hypothetical protein
MSPQEALQLLANVGQAIQANWETHVQIQEAIRVLAEALIPQPELELVDR